MISLFTNLLPREISAPIYAEYSSRKSEIDYLLKLRYYSPLRKEIRTIEMLLAMSIFHKRVISNLDSANKFAGTVFDKSDADFIKIGKYKLDHSEKERIYFVVRSFNKLMSNYSIPSSIISYSETKEFLKEVKAFKQFVNSGKNDSN